MEKMLLVVEIEGCCWLVGGTWLVLLDNGKCRVGDGGEKLKRKQSLSR